MNTLWIVENRKVVEITPIGRKSYPKKRSFVVFKCMMPFTDFLEDGSAIHTKREVVDQINIIKTFKTREDAINSLSNDISVEIDSFQKKIDTLLEEIKKLKE